jgi:hypothetical protein
VATNNTVVARAGLAKQVAFIATQREHQQRIHVGCRMRGGEITRCHLQVSPELRLIDRELLRARSRSARASISWRFMGSPSPSCRP